MYDITPDEFLKYVDVTGLKAARGSSEKILERYWHILERCFRLNARIVTTGQNVHFCSYNYC